MNALELRKLDKYKNLTPVCVERHGKFLVFKLVSPFSSTMTSLFNIDVDDVVYQGVDCSLSYARLSVFQR